MFRANVFRPPSKMPSRTPIVVCFTECVVEIFTIFLLSQALSINSNNNQVFAL